MKKTSKFARFFKFFWLESNPAHEEWDKLLNLLIDKAEVTKIDDYTITFDNTYVVWTSNHPFASGNLYEYKGLRRDIVTGCTSKYHCSTTTKIKLEDFYYNLRLDSSFQEEIERYSSM
jgi:hypothetical protein